MTKNKIQFQKGLSLTEFLKVDPSVKTKIH
jgi:hypothetical protein